MFSENVDLFKEVNRLFKVTSDARPSIKNLDIGLESRNDDEDLQLEKDLLADPKERAEHVMLVDLGRNDLGRVCLPGSVFVKELMVIEKY